MFAQGIDFEEAQMPVFLSSFQGKHQHLMLKKREGYQNEDVLDEASQEGIWHSRRVKLFQTACLIIRSLISYILASLPILSRRELDWRGWS